MRILKSIDFYFFSFIFLIASLPILAPILSTIGLNELSEKIYLIYSFFCHQFHTRSIHIFDHQYAWCARDTGIWIGFFIGAVLYKFRFLKQINFLYLIIFILPIALDGGIQTLFTFGNLNEAGEISNIGYFSNNFLRFLTGSFFGLGLSLFLAPNIIEQIKKSESIKLIQKLKRILNPLNNQVKRITFTMITLVILYIFMIMIWGLTSKNYLPTNPIDSVPKVQEGYFFTRRLNGECPATEETGILNFECLL